MFILAGKFFLWLFSIFMYLINTITLAQPDFIYYDCQNAANYTKNSTYQRNLETSLSALPNTNSGFGFYNFSTGNGNDRVNSMALCRGDVDSNSCRSCLSDSIVKLPQICPVQREAIGYYDNCLLQYSDNIISGYNQQGTNENLVNPQNATDRDRFTRSLMSLLNELGREAAAGGPLRKFATGNTSGPDFTTIYGLAQCTPDLSEQECSDCLDDSVNQFAILYRGENGGRSLLPVCNFRYEIFRFFNGSTMVIPSPPPPPISLVSPPVQKPPGNIDSYYSNILNLD
ncbi:hypothetical protein LXL04_010099 [Taraxacum kok-saghyz]